MGARNPNVLAGDVRVARIGARIAATVYDATILFLVLLIVGVVLWV